MEIPWNGEAAQLSRTDLRAHDHSALTHASFGTRREVPVRSKKSDKLLLFILNVLNMQRKLWANFLPPKMPFFSNLARENNKECNLKGQMSCQMSQILGIRKVYMPIESVE